MNSKEIIVISPSGNFYGSEQVLYDYLNQTSLSGLVFVPQGSEFFFKLVERKFTNFRIIGFKRNFIAGLYILIAKYLLTGNYNGIYLNEAGHIKYFSLLKIFFPSKIFVIHVRLKEDAAVNRWSSISKNRLKAISTSRYIERLLPIPSIMIYDPFKFDKEKKYSIPFESDSIFNVGIIGRVTATKGSNRLPAIIEKLKEKGELGNFHFHFFGDVYPDFYESGLVELLAKTGAVSFHGFISDSAKVYGDLHVVLHLSEQEALGRIFLEALNEEIPFIGLDGGGIGEMANLLGMNNAVVDISNNMISDQIAAKLLFTRENFEQVKSNLVNYKNAARSIFDPVTYSERLDNCF